MVTEFKPLSQPAPKTNPQELAKTIATALEILLDPGQVFEVRALQVQQGYGKPCTISGFFKADRQGFDNAAEAVVKMSPAKGVYFTLNPVKTELLARRRNRLARAQEGESS